MYASDPPMTEREVVLRERAAFVRGASWRFSRAVADAPTRSFRPVDGLDIEAAAAEKFPLPKIIRPRVVSDSAGTKWQMISERLEFRSGDNWHPYLGGAVGYDIGDGFYGTCLRPTPERIKLWSALLAQPTETVEDA